jgi:hypothetical protein
VKKTQGCIYLLVNLINGKRYVGYDETGNPEGNRWKTHIWLAFNTKDRRPLYCAIRKAWRESKGSTIGFSAEIIWRGPISKLHGKEIYYIAKLHSWNGDLVGDCSYNLTKGGDGFHGKHSKAAKKKSSESQRRIWQDPAVHKKHSIALRRYYKSPGAREKQRTILLQAYENPALRKKLSVIHTRRYEDPAERKAQSLRLRRHYEDPKNRKKQSVRSKSGWAKVSPEDRSNIRKRAWAKVSPEDRKDFSSALKRAWAKKTPEERSVIGLKARDTRRVNRAEKLTKH